MAKWQKQIIDSKVAKSNHDKIMKTITGKSDKNKSGQCDKYKESEQCDKNKEVQSAKNRSGQCDKNKVQSAKNKS